MCLFGSLCFLYWLLVIQHMKCWCHHCWCFHMVIGVFSIFSCCFFVGLCSGCLLFGSIVLVVHPFCIALIVHGGSSSFSYCLLVVQYVKWWCHCFWCFCLVFGVFQYCFVAFFFLVTVLFVCCLDALFW